MPLLAIAICIIIFSKYATYWQSEGQKLTVRTAKTGSKCATYWNYQLC